MTGPFAAHPGAHAAPAPERPVFRRAMRMPWRKPAAPADLRTAGAAAALTGDAQPVPGDQVIADVREQWNAWHDGLADAELAAMRPRRRLPREDGEIVIDQRGHVHVRPVNGVYLGRQPRQQPVYGEAPQRAVTGAERDAARESGERARARYQPPARGLLGQVLDGLRKLDVNAGLSFDCGNGLHAPLCSGRNCSCGCHK